MGCGSSSNAILLNGDPKFVEVNSAWDRAWQTVENKKSKKKKHLVVKRSGWKTVRIFVSSTFRDFHQEREVLVKKVFPDLRVWCEAHRLQLVECDLRWGVPSDSNTESTLRACLGEIDRCYHDNIMPFFVNMTSERIGWIPMGDEIPDSIRSEYKWIEGLSVTEMEIIHGAYRKDNPNALFMFRNPAFLDNVPEEYKKSFIDSEPIAPYKLDILKKMINDRFKGSDQVVKYDVEFSGYNPEVKRVELGGLDGTFTEKVFEFFKKRIAEQYPLPEGDLDPYHHIAEQHESFMKNRCLSVLGRDDTLKKIDDYVCGIGCDVPLMLVGGAGTGKSSIMARAADDIVVKSLESNIPGGGKQGWHVFYHFVGAVPGSTELETMLKRLLREIGICNDAKMPKDKDDAVQTCCSALTNVKTRPTIIFVDALNQFDEDMASQAVSWVPRKLAPHIRCIFSMIPDTPQYNALVKREPKPTVLLVTPLDEASRKCIVEAMLGRYNKRLDPEQMVSLLSKSSSENPLWLSIACEELRVFGNFRQLSDKINHLQDGLLELEIQVLERFERENGGKLLEAAVCLLEVSASGLLEVELLNILGDEENLMPSKDTEKKDEGKENTTKLQPLPAYKWAEVYRALKPFVRPFGDSGEGRLDFYHRSFSKAVRRKYFKTADGNDKPDVYYWWHKELAEYFETSTMLHRKVEEYPVHLIAIKNTAQLEKFLTDWTTFDALYDHDYSSKLSSLWSKGSNFDRMQQCYLEALLNLDNLPDVDKENLCSRYEQVSRFFGQTGMYAKATELSQKSIKIELEELGARPERMAAVYQLAGYVLDEKLKLDNYYEATQIAPTRAAIDYFSKSIELLKQIPNDKNKREIATMLNRNALMVMQLHQLGDEEYHDSRISEAKSHALADEAIRLYEELGDEAGVSNVMITKAAAIIDPCPEQIEMYKKALDKTLEVVGEVHVNTRRALLNIGIYHEQAREYYKAYDYFRWWYRVTLELIGEDHPLIVRCIKTLREPFYIRIARKKGDDVPEMPKPHGNGQESDHF